MAPWPLHRRRAWMRASDRAAARGGDEPPPGADVDAGAAAEASALEGTIAGQPVVGDSVEGRPKRGRLPDPDLKDQHATPPPGWGEPIGGGLPPQW